jgi:dTDP-4-amino-4,6-dideoxy-D-galactose acyltransferase
LGSTSLIERLGWDSSFFGVEVGRVLSCVRPGDMAATMSEAEAQGLDCLYLRVEAHDTELVAAAEDHGFRVKEIRVDLERPIRDRPADRAKLRVAAPRDLSRLAGIARDRFRETRFFADTRFDPSLSAELYVEWLRRGLDGEGQRQVLMTPEADGFVVCCLDRESARGTIELIGVAASAVRRGIGRTLMEGAEALFRSASLESAQVATQGTNIGALALYEACGYRVTGMFYGLHAWLSPQAA